MTAPAAPAAPAPPATSSGGRTRRILPVAVAVAAVLLVALLSAGSSSGGSPYDPSSTAPDGAKALALLLGQVGPGVDTVSQVPPVGQRGIALVLVDRLGQAGDSQLDDWVRGGGTLVAADPGLVGEYTSPVSLPANEGLESEGGPTNLDCPLAALAGVNTVDPAGGLVLNAPPGATACFRDANGAGFLVVEPHGQGELVLLGGPDLWTNHSLGTADNSVLAADLLVPRPDGPRVQWIVGLASGNGKRSLSQLIPDRVDEALAIGGLAVLILALWRARRLGRPVLETPPVQLPGSELVVAVGNLLHQGGRRGDAAEALRATLRRDLANHLALPLDAAPHTVAAVVADRTGLDPAMVEAAVAGPPPTTDAQLVALAADADTIRRSVTQPERLAANAT